MIFQALKINNYQPRLFLCQLKKYEENSSKHRLRQFMTTKARTAEDTQRNIIHKGVRKTVSIKGAQEMKQISEAVTDVNQMAGLQIS